jgi:hypothetical protein
MPTRFDEDKFWSELDIAPEPMTDAERETLRHMLSHTLLRKALAHVMHEMQASEASWLGVDMSTPEGVTRVMQLQSEVKGILRAVQALVDLTKEEEQDDT